ncbi:ChrA protein [Geobacillus subterraneus]|uniref:ChrA protein n=2 Tax=Geobacillus TaxID=129337 RepID=A0ABM6ABH2_9BACL|nr:MULTISPECIES: chromate efflux transporter [Geobacillus]AMX83652.1 ChrA protein [Geobacillus subterraneus]KZS24562.1 ChrA protein [Geobacillus subterraneus]OXB87868.1 ChrA protein [Geobacillus uzenensis]WPZ19938.1 chromate efflux transporter [Geobacillus subterraneus]
MTAKNRRAGDRRGSVFEVGITALRLGLTSFGGPVAHLGYFYEEYVKRKKWIDDKTYADLVALCQFLPGPASSQVGIGIGLMRAGVWGALAAWLGFTLPSAVALSLVAVWLQHASLGEAGWMHGLLLAAVAVVAQAVWEMARKFAAGRLEATLAVAAAIAVLLMPGAWSQVTVIAIAGAIGAIGRRKTLEPSLVGIPPFIRRSTGFLLLSLFAVLLVALPLARAWVHSPLWALFDSFYRAGALVFGGGHVVLPLLEAEVVPQGWVTADQFLAGYSAAQAVPGPLFTFAAYIGMAAFGWKGTLVATAAIFLPSFLLVLGAFPFWHWLRRQPRFQAALAGINAAVVGILLAALYDPIWTKAVNELADFAFVLVAFLLLAVWKWPAWAVVLVSFVGGWLRALFG